MTVRPDLVFYRVCRFLSVTVFCGLWFRASYEGRENVPASGPYVVAPVHRSNLDTLIVGGLSRRRLRFMGKDSLWKIRFFGALFSALGAFPVHRGSADREALRRSIEVLKGGEPLVMFPEGTRQSGPTVQPLFEGAAYMACRAGVPIVPVGIGGSEAAMPKGSKMIRPVKVHVVVGRPIVPPAPTDGGRVPRAAVHDVTEQLHAELQTLFDAARHRVGDP
ncbi:MAG TPA: lysophospholipid acyltransferase family protein [Acidimicrobiales bacterium]|nr:lysophospholipid acyltransferase family protein [Acidimicrobiales bacterium]